MNQFNFAFQNITVCAAALFSMTLAGHVQSAEPQQGTSNYKQLVKASFEHWRNGTGGPFDLLAEEAQWTIVGSSPLSQTYQTKEEFMAGVIRPFNARMQQPLRPTVKRIYEDGDTVIIHFDAESLCHDGIPYRNTYVWLMRFQDGKAVQVTAFFDTRWLDEMWNRVKPITP